MNKNQKQIIMVAALGAVLVGVVLFQMLRKPPSSPVPTGPAAASNAAPGKTAAPAGKTPASKTPATAGKTSKASASARAAAEPTAQIRRVDVNIEDLLAGIKEVTFDYDQESAKRDPMAPLVGGLSLAVASKDKDGESVAPATVGQVMNKTVTGIIWDKRSPLAVVDNEVIYRGYRYPDGTLVESVAPDRVTFKVGDSSIQVKLKEQ